MLVAVAAASATLTLTSQVAAQVQSPDAPGRALLQQDDVLDAPMLARKLKDRIDPLSAYLWSGFTAERQQALANAASSPSSARAVLVDGLNSVIQGGNLYEAKRFSRVALSPSTRALLVQDPQGGDELMRLNRLLLEDAYPRDLRRSLPAPLATGVSTDKSDYAPGTTAYIRGWGFEAGESVSVQVLHADGTPDSGSDHEPWLVAAGSGGAFETTWHVCEDDCLGSMLLLTAVGLTSGRTAEARFTDSEGTPTYQLLKAFIAVPNGAGPRARLMQATDGVLYGTAAEGGIKSAGTIFKMNPDGNGVTAFHHFDASDPANGAEPWSEVTQGPDGALYGTTRAGGSAGRGTVYRINPDGTGFTILHSFDDTTGASPESGVIVGVDGWLYGTTYAGGSAAFGTVYKLRRDGTAFTVLENFDLDTTGGFVSGGLVQGTDGTLYGTTSQGGSPVGYGTIYKLSPDGSGFTVLRVFENYPTGASPQSELIQGMDGSLYGTTYEGGSAGAGTVFKIGPDGTGFTVLQSFDSSTTGNAPHAGVVQGSDGTLYGTTSSGGSFSAGTVFRLNPDGSGFTVLQALDYSTTGFAPFAAVIHGADGALYGTTNGGGSGGFGTVFRVKVDGTAFTTLYAFSSFEGAYPYSSLVQGTDGSLYGTTFAGGSEDLGTIYRLNPDGTGFTVVRTFDDVTTGSRPTAAPIVGADGMLYGTAQYGGDYGYGTVYRMNQDGTGFSRLWSFDFSNGTYPSAGVIQGSDGALYGTTQFNGSLGYGTIYKLNTDGTGFTVLKSFDYDTTGGYVYAGLIQGVDGSLYGTATFGGTGGFGTVYKLNLDGTGFTILRAFDALTTGSYVAFGVIQGTDGLLYGTTGEGGSEGIGTIYRLNPDGTGFTVFRSLDQDTTGGYPFTGLVQGADGSLYGTTVVGGSSGWGTVFKASTDGTALDVVHTFDSSTTGTAPYGSLILARDGNLYGTTSGGGPGYVGTVFRLVFNNPPIADAGVDFSVNEGLVATLDGGASSDPGGGAIAYSWTQLPGGTPVSLSGADTASPSFTAPSVAFGGETLRFELTVTASGGTATDTVSVTILNVNHTPVADAGSDQSVVEGSPVTLHGEVSFDVDADPITYEWVQVGGTPAVSLTGADTANPTFTAPPVGAGGAALVFELHVDDGYPPDAPAPGHDFADVRDRVTVEITDVNNAPIAMAGADQTVHENTVVTLGGGGSDPDGDALTYAWAQVGGTPVTLADRFSAITSFTAPLVSAGGEDLAFELAVDDGRGGTATDMVVVHVQNAGEPPNVSAAQPTIALLWPPNHALVAVGITGVTDPDGDVTITITSVTQDEPTSGLRKEGDVAIDAMINANGTVLLRAERAGGGDGRVYHVHFTASNSEGSVSGMVTVVVPRNKGGTAIDGGELYDSTH